MMSKFNLKLFLLSCLLLALLILFASRKAPLSQAQAQRVLAVTFTESLLQQLKVPPGFKIDVFAKDLGGPRMLAVLPDGSLLVTRPENNDVLLLQDKNNDHRSDRTNVIASGLDKVHGIAIHGNQVYLATVKEIYVSDIQEDSISKPRAIVFNLPDGGYHFRRCIEFGKDSMMYVSIGSTCNNCMEADQEHAAILQFTLNGKERRIFARGLRNTMGYGWHPQTGEMWGMDIGSDWRGNNNPPEELNQIKMGGDYGWPVCFGKQQIDSQSPKPPGSTKVEYCKNTIASTLDYDAHSTPIDFLFYTGAQFPAEYKNDAFVTLHGSWNRKPPSGYKIARIHFENGKPEEFEDFITGFLIDKGKQFISRPAGLALGTDGSLFISDDGNGVIYRVSYNRK